MQESSNSPKARQIARKDLLIIHSLKTTHIWKDYLTPKTAPKLRQKQYIYL
jgi:hypothetical protein